MLSNRADLFPTVVRIVLGAVFLVFGLNGFLQFMPMPAMPEAAGGFLGALAATGYMMPLIKGVEVLAGLMLLSGFYVPLALALLAPNIVNITLFHLFLAPGGLVFALVLLAAGLYLAWSYRDLYRPMLSANVLPTASKLPRQRHNYDHSGEAHNLAAHS